MNRAREAIIEHRFPQYLIGFFRRYFQDPEKYPSVALFLCVGRAANAENNWATWVCSAWAVEALQSVGVDIVQGTWHEPERNGTT